MLELPLQHGYACCDAITGDLYHDGLPDTQWISKATLKDHTGAKSHKYGSQLQTEECIGGSHLPIIALNACSASGRM